MRPLAHDAAGAPLFDDVEQARGPDEAEYVALLRSCRSRCGFLARDESLADRLARDDAAGDVASAVSSSSSSSSSPPPPPTAGRTNHARAARAVRAQGFSHAALAGALHRLLAAFDESAANARPGAPVTTRRITLRGLLPSTSASADQSSASAASAAASAASSDEQTFVVSRLAVRGEPQVWVVIVVVVVVVVVWPGGVCRLLLVVVVCCQRAKRDETTALAVCEL